MRLLFDDVASHVKVLSFFIRAARDVSQECDKFCREFLLFNSEHGKAGDDEHLAGNVMDHLQGADSQDMLDMHSECDSMLVVWQKIQRFLLCPVLPFVWCIKHQRYCFLHPVDVDCSGFPCQDYSPAGKQRGVFGRTFTTLLALLAWHRSSKTRILLLENVAEFPLVVLRLLMADLYDIREFYMTPSDVGCPLSRLRVFIVLTLKGVSAQTSLSQALRFLMIHVPLPDQCARHVCQEMLRVKEMIA